MAVERSVPGTKGDFGARHQIAGSESPCGVSVGAGSTVSSGWGTVTTQLVPRSVPGTKGDFGARHQIAEAPNCRE